MGLSRLLLSEKLVVKKTEALQDTGLLMTCYYYLKFGEAEYRIPISYRIQKDG